MRMILAAAAVLTLSACATATSQPACAVSEADRAWIDRALEAWRFASREISHVGPAGDYGAVFFDEDCVLHSPNALSASDPGNVRWTATPHAGMVTLPDGQEIPVGVTSFATSDEGNSFFVMATPSVWSAGGVRGDPLDLETLMVFVLLHEGSHVAQMATYGEQVGALAERNGLPESFNDDSLQDQFAGNPEFSASIARETDLFVRAATAADDAEAFALAREARVLMQARARRFFVGDLAYNTEAEALWLTFEGSGQWAGYAWLVHPEGMSLTPELARRAAMRSRWWSQNQGLAIALTLDRLGAEDWRRVAFGDGSQTLLDMLDAALAEPAP